MLVQGENLNIVSGTDYNIKVGQGSCNITLLAKSLLVCDVFGAHDEGLNAIQVN